ncbi:MAG: hypothetical protein A3C02_00940 [Candidatus Andersenbacteria bacterium RIFCSPHIGHO2_02_FULL_45_11]|uniref:Glycosyl transferase family 1 domain-containing protein n=1 Tax=Candidatus Andersenbacteria bacterium RIFCSPHIGHO2_12_FULL_45_11 TaxID=1797281 RepID=A0A1G1X181_9BACT|nr:MAG: hypothetical protein A2805_00565 [Candidatus Andersenbacteria bacterium RIFCSPHIGHO2_01_FULL_46_36]OGY33117.1 MAG: hypothetical protein A3D99_01510 [Candidatus Andersenbacteria bacterium RIFCSPHIGHO2_12_FULL_45_11]OGY33142.1 MAG: hypothetical protein A3C02_00940 [Candidatus Andersenbacteria bacterium RIFCSPHIGHO2_02_FULL_45_11]
MKQTVLFLSWKDITHPSAGGAELLTDTLAQHLTSTYDVLYFTSAYPGAKKSEEINGYRVMRRGSQFTTHLYAILWWHLHGRALQYTYIIDQVHGFPFFSTLYIGHPKVITLVMEVAGDIWDTLRSPFLRIIGKGLERLWLRLYRNNDIVTISKSTKRELIEHRVTTSNISIIPMFSQRILPDIPPKSDIPTLLVVGRIAPVKQIEHAIDAYMIAKRIIPSLRLVIIGKTEQAYEAYKSFLLKKIVSDPDITFIENASEEKKQEWMEHSHMLLMTSQKEGYGLVILEAAACGTPTIGYRVQGIQDAILDTSTGMLVENQQPAAMAESICEILLHASRYTDMQKKAYEHATTHTKKQTCVAFTKTLYGTTKRTY